MGVPIPQPASASVDSASGAQVIDGSLKFNSASSQYLSSASTFANEDDETITFSFWLKRHAPTATKATQYVFSTNTEGTIFFDSGNDDELSFNLRGTGGSNFFTTTLTNLRDFSAWSHIVVNINVRSLVQANRFRVFINGVQQSITSTSYPQNPYHSGGTWYIGSYGGSSHYPDFSLSNFYCIAGQALGPEYFGFTDPLTDTWKPKKYENTTIGASPTLSNGALIIRAKDASIRGQFISGSAFEDGSGGGNLNFFTSDNGSTWTRTGSGKKTTFAAKYLAAGGAGISPKTFIPDNDELFEYHVWNDNTNFDTGSGHTTDVTGKTFIDSKPANFGANGFYLPMDNQDDFEKDKSGNGNDWTKNNFSGTETDPDVLKDSPSGAAFGGAPTSGVTTTSSAPSNYCTWNPIDNINVELSDGNLKCTDSAGNYDTVFGTQTSVDGKHYFEVTVTALTTTMAVGVYVGNNRSGIDGSNYPYDANAYMTHKNGLVYHDGATHTYQSAYGAGDTVGVAIDSENRKAWVSVNGSYVSGDNPETGAGGMQSISGVGAMPDGEIYPVIMIRSATTVANFGQKPFKYAPPKGFKSLSSAGTKPATVISDPTQFVGVTTYRGNGSSGRAFDLGMSPDFVWVKRRDGTYDNMLFDTVRGDGKEIYSERNYAQGSPGTSKLDFIVNGFDLPSTGVNVNGNSYVAWFWKAGGKKNTFNVDDVGYSSASDAGLDGGTITPSGASVGTKQGFSIIKWTGVNNASPQTISHGLTNQTPRFFIVKNLTDAENWAVYHASVGATKYGRLNSNVTYDTSSAYWNNTAPTTTLITLNNSNEVQRINRDYVLYAWADVPGLQKFGSYTCNGDGSGGGAENGPYVELGFRPALILFKGSSYVSDWTWIDEERCKVNYNDVALRANYQYSELGNARGGVGSSSQPANYAVDFLSNGFKIRASGGSLNSGTNTVTYAAWAKSPFSDLYGGGANAR